MKKFGYIVSIIFLTAFTGCVKMEIDPAPKDMVIFSVGHYIRTSKAASLLDTDGGITSFKSKAYLYAEGYMDRAQSFFGSNGETISWNASTSQWAPSHPYYWPKSSNSYINFVSWYDRNGAPTNVSETALSWNIDGSSRSIAADDNIMFADEAWHYNQNTTNAAQYTGDEVLVGVPTLFHHALAQVSFRLKATTLSDGGTTWEIYATDFSVSNVYKTGSLSLSNEDPGTNQTRAWTGDWATTGTPDSLAAPGAGVAINPTDTVAYIMQNRSVIPQSTDSMVLSCNIHIRSNYADNSYMIEDVPFSANLSDFTGDSGAWAMNHHIIYTLKVNPNTGKILFDPTLLEGWTTDANNLMYIE